MDHQEQSRAGEIERVLLEGADSRLIDYKIELDRIFQFVTNAFVFRPDGSERNYVTGEKRKRYFTNKPEMDTALAFLRSSISKVYEMRTQAISRDDVAVALQQISAELVEPLSPFELDPPTIDDKGEVKKPTRLAVIASIK